MPPIRKTIIFVYQSETNMVFLFLMLFSLISYALCEDATFIDHPNNDGDSFYLSINNKKTLVRLYEVDAPESKKGPTKHILEQGKYFNKSFDETIKLKIGAKNYLKNNKFKVYHKNQLLFSKRLLVKITFNDGSDFGDLLVQKKLARKFGVKY